MSQASHSSVLTVPLPTLSVPLPFLSVCSSGQEALVEEHEEGHGLLSVNSEGGPDSVFCYDVECDNAELFIVLK